jgi:hypothetical protein
MEGLAKALQVKQGEVTYLFYNSAKNVYWIEAGVQAKVLMTHPSLENQLIPRPYRNLWLVLCLLHTQHVST